MTYSELIEYIRRRLGEPVVAVELDDNQIDAAVNATLWWWNARRGLERVGTLQVVEGQSEYRLPDEVKVVFNVYGVERGYGGILGGLTDIFQDFGWTPGLVPLPRGKLPAFSGVVLFLQKMETIWRIAQRELLWEFKNGVLRIYPTPSSDRVGLYYYDYKCDLTADNLEALEASPIDRELFIRYAVAECKEMLGRIRSKYSNYPAAEGEVSLDGGTLLAEAKEEKEKIEAEIAARMPPIPFLTG